MGIFQARILSGLPSPPGDLDPGIESVFLHWQADSFINESLREAKRPWTNDSTSIAERKQASSMGVIKLIFSEDLEIKEPLSSDWD